MLISYLFNKCGWLVRVLWRGLGLHGGCEWQHLLDKPARIVCRWHITACVASSEETFCRLVSEFGRVCERKKLLVSVGENKVMIINVVRINARLNSGLLEGLDCSWKFGSHVSSDGGCERDVVCNNNEGYKAREALKSVLIAIVWKKCWKKKSAWAEDAVFEKCGRSDTNEQRELGITRRKE